MSSDLISTTNRSRAYNFALMLPPVRARFAQLYAMIPADVPVDRSVLSQEHTEPLSNNS